MLPSACALNSDQSISLSFGIGIISGLSLIPCPCSVENIVAMEHRNYSQALCVCDYKQKFIIYSGRAKNSNMEPNIDHTVLCFVICVVRQSDIDRVV